MNRILLTLLLFLPLFGGNLLMADDHLSDRLLFSARMEGGQEVPAVNTDAAGVAALYLNPGKDSLCINISFTGTSSTVTGLHIHEGAAGTNGPVVWNLTNSILNNQVGITIPITAAELAKFMKGMYYLNLHTTDNPSGEIRGQISLEKDISHYAWLDESYVRSGAAGYGLALFNVSQDKRKMEVYVVTHGLTGRIIAAHLHSVFTTNVVVGLDSLISTQGDQIWGVVDATGFNTDSLKGAFYLNVHTSTNLSGEVAGVIQDPLDQLNFDAQLDASFHSGTAPARGVAQLRLSPTMDTLRYMVVWDTLTSALTGIHIHEASGAVAHNMTPDTVGENAVRGQWVNPPLNIINEMLIGDAYINVHSTMNPNGEIGGNIYRFAREGFLINMDGNQEVPAISVNGTGGGMVSIDRKLSSCHYMMTAEDLTGPIVMAHFHNGVAGTNGPVLFTIPFTNDAAFGYWNDASSPAFSSADGLRFLNDSIYVNIHTSANASGEIRGQVLRENPCFETPVAVSAPVNPTSMTAYPNPVIGDVVNIRFEAVRTIESVRLLDLTGREVLRREQLGAVSGLRLELRDLPAGTYLLQVKAVGEVAAVRKLIVE